MSDGQDENEFERLLRPELPRLFRLAFRLTGSSADAEDLVQEVLVKVYRRREELGSITVLAPWLARILYNRFIDDTRRSKRRHLNLVSLDDDTSNPESVHSTVRSECPGPRELVEQEFDIRAVAKALNALTREQRTVLLMHDSEGYTLQEIELMTGMPIGTVKSRLHRARARLRILCRDPGTF